MECQRLGSVPRIKMQPNAPREKSPLVTAGMEEKSVGHGLERTFSR